MATTLELSSASRLQSNPPEVKTIAEIIEHHENILIIGHIRPDGDCFGSCLGLYHALVAKGKSPRFFTAGPVQSFFKYLPGFDKIETVLPTEGYTLTICVDTADPNRVFDGFVPPANTINIDHHVSNTAYGAINWIDANATAAAEMIYRLLPSLEVELNAEMAICIFTGLMTDTGGFRFSNTDQDTFQIASHLVQAGANPAAIAEAVFDSRSKSSVILTGEVYRTLQFEFDGQFVWNYIDMKRVADAGLQTADTEGLSSDLRGIEGVEVSILFQETPEGYCRIGFRSRGRVNVSELAKLMGGGGHICASGATVKEKPFSHAMQNSLVLIRNYLKSHLS